MSDAPKNPPKWMDKFLAFYCRPDLLEDLQGDLYEYYDRNLEKGKFKANLIFFIDVVKFCRLYTVRKPKILDRMTFFHLFKNYFKTSLRSLRRHKLFSIINVVGLAISMAVGLLLISYLIELDSFDDFHDKGNRIYRVISDYKGVTSENTTHLASTSIFLGKKLQKDYTGFEDLVILRRITKQDLVKGDNTIPVNGIYATESFFNIFQFDLTLGNPNAALLEPYSMVITQKVADQLSLGQNPLDQFIVINEERFKVTGVISEVPNNSHLQFDIIISMKTKELQESKDKESSFFTWRSVWMNYVYFTLSEGQSPAVMQQHLDKISAQENAKNERYAINFQTQPLQEILPGINLSNQIGPSEDFKTIYQLLVLTLIVLLSACFNYTNLSIARSLRRSKEVGIRKAVGATKNQVLVQFIFESLIVSFIALIISFGLFELLKNQFLDVVIRGVKLSLELKWYYFIYFIGFGLVIGIVSGILPALFLSKLKASSIFSDASKIQLFKGVTLRRVLIVLQFSLSMAFVMGATIAYRQYNFALNFDLGFQTENILNVELKGNEPEVLLSEYQKMPEVQKASLSALIPGAGSTWSDNIKYQDPLDSVMIYINQVDSGYLRLHGFQLIAGNTFPRNLNPDESGKYIIIDEKLRKRFGFADATSAIGEILSINDRTGEKRLEVSGVINSYQYTTIQSESEPTALLQGMASDFSYINLKVSTADILGLMSKLESTWTAVDQVHPFEAYFFEESIKDVYYEYKVMFKVFTFLAVLAIVIAAMGLLGMAVFTTETRMKEISVRKVMGASERELIYLLSSGFLIMLLISAVVAIPSTYILFERYVLEDYVNRIDIGLLEVLPGVIIIFLIGGVAIIWQTIKAAKTNPAEMLRSE